MEKKGSRSLQPSPKGLVTDSKKNQDVVSGKVWPRGGSRRREPSNGSLSSKNDLTSRKPNPQRNKTTVDKRPKQRGAYGQSNVLNRNETTRLVECQEAELGSVFLPGSKKQSLNHLLNFHYAPREGQHVQHHQHYAGRNGKHDRGHRTLSTQKHKYNKEHFLQANCQFIVNALGDYKQYMNNPDALVDWNLIEQVNLQVTEFPSCPICLYPPVAAKMTRCGHIYCWSCMIHYLTISENSAHKCPICFVPILQQDLKSVVTVPHATFNLNETITFKLMKRARDSLTAYPIDQVAKNDDVIFNLSEKECNSVYSKLLLASTGDILTIIERERRELQMQIVDDENKMEAFFIEQAMELLNEREANIFGNFVTTESNKSEDRLTVNSSVESELEEKLGDLSVQEDSIVACDSMTEESFMEESDFLSGVYANGADTSGSCLTEARKFHYFYQASDGQHIYLHPVNAKMLEHTYGSLEAAPKTVTGRILEKEGGSMTEELRNRLRYLKHLPVTCQFELAEIHLKYPTVTKETLDHFRQQLDARRKARNNRQKDEKRREKRIMEEENRKMGRYPEPNLKLESHEHFPEFGIESHLSSVPEENAANERSYSLDPQPSTSLSSSWPPKNEGPSFAKMVASAKVRSPNVKCKSSSQQAASPSEDRYIHVTGANMKMTPRKKFIHSSDSEGETEEYQHVPQSKTSFGDLMAQALQRAETQNIVYPEMGDSLAVGRKKKKKNKMQLLYSTDKSYPRD